MMSAMMSVKNGLGIVNVRSDGRDLTDAIVGTEGMFGGINIRFMLCLGCNWVGYIIKPWKDKKSRTKTDVEPVSYDEDVEPLTFDMWPEKCPSCKNERRLFWVPYDVAEQALNGALLVIDEQEEPADGE